MCAKFMYGVLFSLVLRSGYDVWGNDLQLVSTTTSTYIIICTSITPSTPSTTTTITTIRLSYFPTKNESNYSICTFDSTKCVSLLLPYKLYTHQNECAVVHGVVSSARDTITFTIYLIWLNSFGFVFQLDFNSFLFI